MKVRHFSHSVLCGALLASCGGGGGGGSHVPAPSGLSYSDASPSYAACTPIAANLPALASGSATSFSVEPALPAGLTLDAATGAITGAPTELAPSAAYVVTASNSSGSASATLTLEVLASDPVGLDYGSADLAFAFGFESSYAPTLASGTASDWSIVSGSLPAGVVLDPLTGQLSGKPPHALTPTENAITIRATNCVGASISVALTVGVVQPTARAAYGLCDGEPLISTFVADSASGLLWSRGSELTTDSASGELAVTADGRWLVVAEGDYAALRTFACAPATGRLTDGGPQISTGAVPATALALHPSSTFVYASTADGSVLGFAIDGQSGALTPTSQGSVVVGDEPSSLAIDPFGRFLFVATALDARVEAFAIDSATGALASAGDVATGSSPGAAVVSPDGAWLFVSSAGEASIRAFAIHPVSGALSPVAGSPFATPGGESPAQLATDSTGEHLYVLHAFDAAIDAFDVNAGGSLSPLVSPTTSLERPGSRLVRDPSGSMLYALVDGRGWFAFQIAGDGSLHAAPTERITARPSSRALAFQPGVAELRVAASHVYVASADGKVFQNSVATDGTLAPLAPASISASTAAVRWIELHPRLSLAWVATAASTPIVFDVGVGGELTLALDGAPSTSSRSIHLEPSGRFAYEVQDGATPIVQRYAVDESTGALTALEAIGVSTGPGPIAMHPAGRFLYVPCAGADSIDVFEIDWATGMLIDWPQTLTGDAPTQLAITESGSHLLCLESTASVVAVYAVDPLTGALEVLPGTFNSVGAGAVALAVDPIGGTVFVAGASGSAIRAFSLDASDGTLLDLGFAAPGSTPTSMRVDPSGSFLYAARADGTLARIAFDSGAGFGVLQSLSASGAQLELGVHTVVR